MKNLLLATVVAFLPFGAIAADLPKRASAPAPVAAAPKFTWTGLYAGVHAGYIWGDAEVNYALSIDTPGGDVKGFIGGGLIGYNWQRGSIVYGLEADIGFGNVDGFGGVKGEIPTYTYDLKWNAHVRARLGLALDRTFVFVAGGLAIARHELGDAGGYAPAFVLLGPPPSPEAHSHSGTHVGWTIGAGFEHAWTNNFVTRVEYLYDDYGRKTYDAEDGLKVKLTGHTARIGLIWKF